MKIKAVFFDLDDTLYDSHKPFKDAIQTTVSSLPENINLESLYKKFREFSDELWNQYALNELSLEELRIQRISQALGFYGIPITREVAKEFQESYEECQKKIKVFQEIPEVIQELQQNEIQVGIITNGPVKHQKDKIDILNLGNWISTNFMFISDEVGKAKPNPEIFQHAADSIKFSNQELLYVGDSWDNDVVGAMEAGWRSVWFNHRKRSPKTSHKPFAEVNELTYLLSLLTN